MTFVEACQPLRNSYGTVGWGNNPHLFCAQFIKILFDRKKQLDMLDWIQTKEFIQSCEIEPGLYGRWPNDHGQVSHDELRGIAYLSWKLDFTHALSIVLYGNKTDWVFNSQSPSDESPRFWLGRMIDFEPMVRAAARMPVSLWKQLLWTISALASAYGKDSGVSGRIMTWIDLEIVDQDRYPLMQLGAYLFRSKMKKRYPGGPKELLGIYHGKTHPFTQYSIETY